jgi:hypothetical protein
MLSRSSVSSPSRAARCARSSVSSPSSSANRLCGESPGHTHAACGAERHGLPYTPWAQRGSSCGMCTSCGLCCGRHRGRQPACHVRRSRGRCLAHLNELPCRRVALLGRRDRLIGRSLLACARIDLGLRPPRHLLHRRIHAPRPREDARGCVQVLGFSPLVRNGHLSRHFTFSLRGAKRARAFWADEASHRRAHELGGLFSAAGCHTAGGAGGVGDRALCAKILLYNGPVAESGGARAAGCPGAPRVATSTAPSTRLPARCPLPAPRPRT